MHAAIVRICPSERLVTFSMTCKALFNSLDVRRQVGDGYANFQFDCFNIASERFCVTAASVNFDVW